MEEGTDPRVLCSDAPRILSADRPLWPEDELCEIVRRQKAALFQSTPKARLMAALTSVGEAGDALGKTLHAALRRALIDTPTLAASSEVATLVSRIAPGRILDLPIDVSRPVLRALAAANASVLAMPRDRLGDHRVPSEPFVDEEDAMRLLEALEPLCASRSEGAFRTVIQILKVADTSPARLAVNSRLRHLKLLQLVSGDHVSLQELAAAATGGRLFRNDIAARKLTDELRAAIEQSDLVIIAEELAGILEREGGREGTIGIRAFRPDAEGIANFIHEARPGFRNARDRSGLLGQLLSGSGSSKLIEAARCVAVGDSTLPQSARLFRLPPGTDALERFFTQALAGSAGLRLVPRDALDRSTLKGAERLNIVDIKTLAEPFARVMVGARFDAAEYEAFCRLPFGTDWLAAQPVHLFEDSTSGAIDKATVRHDDRAVIQESLRPLVRVLRRAEGSAAAFHEQVVPRWRPERSLALALGTAAPHRHCAAIMDSLLRAGPDVGRTKLQSTVWLPLADGKGAAAPNDVLDLPRAAMEEARRLLPDRALPLRSDLDPALFHHPAASRLDELFEARAMSIDLLAMMISEVGTIVGQPGAGACDPDTLADLATLAKQKAERPVPGWPLQAALLADRKGDDSKESKALAELLKSFAVTSDATHSADMNSLASLAVAGGRTGEAARRLHRRWWCRAAEWTDMPGDLMLPATDGGWRAASALTRESVPGVATGHRLLRDYDQGLDTGDGATRGTIRREGDPISGTLPSEIVEKSRQTLQSVLAEWSGAVPSDLILIALRLAGGGDAFVDLVDAYARRSSAGGREAIWAKLEDHLDAPGLMDPDRDWSFEGSAKNRILYAYRGAADAVSVRTLDGHWRDLPAGGDGWLLRGERHRLALEARGRLQFRLAELAPGAAPSDPDRARDALLHLILEIGEHLHGLSGKRLEALRTFAEAHAEPTQTTLRHVEAQLIDRLPTILDQLKPASGSRLAVARDEYRRQESQLVERPERLAASKDRLWQTLREDSGLQGELLAIVRAAVGQDGYDGRSVLLELFQNAEDAYRQSGAEAPTRPSFSVASGEGVMQAWHDGRRINDRGPDRTIAEKRGYDRDFFNMLVRGLSEKQAQDGAAGRFGLGFKSVHLLADEVRIASGTLAARITGALVLDGWADAPAECRGGATLIELRIDPESGSLQREALNTFSTALPWLLATSRQISEVKSPDGIWRRETCVVLADGIEWLAISGQKALRLDLGDGFRMILALENGQPVPIDGQSRGLWSLVPLRDRIGSGWIIDGPWQIDPGRNHVRDPGSVLARLGNALADRLLVLIDLLTGDAKAAETILEATPSASGLDRFTSGLHAIFVEHGEAEGLIAEGRGWAGVALRRAVIPTFLPAPFNRPVRASERLRSPQGLLHDAQWLQAVAEWPSLAEILGSVVSADTSSDLSALGLPRPQPLTLNGLVRMELERLGGEVGYADATRIGSVLRSMAEADGNMLMREPLLGDTLRVAKMPNRAGQYRLSNELLRPGECLFDDIVPEEWRLADAFVAEGPARFFFERCRDRTGFSADEPYRLGRWLDAESPETGVSLLRKLLKDKKMAKAAPILFAKWPEWLPRHAELLRDFLDAHGWQTAEVESAVYELFGMEDVLERQRVLTRDEGEDVDLPDFDGWLTDLSHWWLACHIHERGKADRRSYPDDFHPSALPRHDEDLDAEGRTRWFTMLALARFRAIGRTRDEQHREYVETALRESWWHELAQPPDGNKSQWLARLQAWSEPRINQPLYEHWGSCFVDLYRLSRWLPAYVEVLLRVPRILAKEVDSAGFDLILRPERSRAWERMGLDAASLHRPLRSGICWLLRELLRHGIFDEADSLALAPFLWQPTGRLCDALEGFGITLDGQGPDRSIAIEASVRKNLGPDKALFLGDHDLPLQIALDGSADTGWRQWREQTRAGEPDRGEDGAARITA